MQYNARIYDLTLFVIAGQGPSLFGRDWLKKIQLDWRTIGLTRLDPSRVQLNNILQRYHSVFEDGLGTMKKFQAELHLKDHSCKPVFKRARLVPFALREALEHELDRLESEGVIEKVNHSSWASPIVVVPKGDGKLRICGDFKVSDSQLILYLT